MTWMAPPPVSPVATLAINVLLETFVADAFAGSLPGSVEAKRIAAPASALFPMK